MLAVPPCRSGYQGSPENAKNVVVCLRALGYCFYPQRRTFTSAYLRSGLTKTRHQDSRSSTSTLFAVATYLHSFMARLSQTKFLNPVGSSWSIFASRGPARSVSPEFGFGSRAVASEDQAIFYINEI
ncbi:hypothetical protein Hypma_015728 [Hypsizygus marmoreus]|uniref:Uncharacterized protein n=1 Tax=Hypsizygus marmoreus TaxID=39966 RepID=A0A369K817_HYPMA|nr:hypothetical protein Hypma_015728 [Hypsizygus marmoreus]